MRQQRIVLNILMSVPTVLDIMLVKSMCESAQLMAPVYTPVFHLPESPVFVSVQTKQLTPVQLFKPLQQNRFIDSQDLKCCFNIF